MAEQGAGIVVELTAAGTELARVASALSHPEDIMDRIGTYLVASTLRRFETESGPGGKPWLKSIRVLAEGGQTLTGTGRLRGSIAHTLSEGGRAVEVGSGVVYAAIHQFGGRAGRGRRARIPARPYLGVDESDRDAISRIVARAIQGATT